MWFGGLDILDLIGIYPKSDEIKDLRVCHNGTGNVNMNWEGRYCPKQLRDTLGSW